MSELFEGEPQIKKAVDMLPSYEKLPVMQESQVPAVRVDSLPMDMRGDPLVRLAIEKDFDADKLEKIIALFNKQEDRRIREDFETVFAQMQSELPVITKSTKGHTNKYAALENIQKACAPVLKKYGFSYRWREESLPGAQGKRIIFTISRKGYSVENSFDVPPLPTNAATNPVQAAGGMTSYGHRYTFTAGLGLILEGEDTDGNYTMADIDAAEKHIAPIRNAKNRDELQRAFAMAWSATRDDKKTQALIMAAKDTKKEELDGSAH